MICKHNKTNLHFNYEFMDNDLVKIWNPDKKFGNNGFFDIITYHRWLDDYSIIDKWKTIKNFEYF